MNTVLIKFGAPPHRFDALFWRKTKGGIGVNSAPLTKRSDIVIDPRILDQFASKLTDLLPSGASVLKDDLERNMRANVQALFARMDLVSGEEFAVQSALLERTRLKLENLEQRVVELEQVLLNQAKS